MIILVTGASGFVGASLAETLAAQGHAVRAAARSPLPARLGGKVTPALLPDLAAGNRLDDAFDKLLVGAEAVVHAAGLAHQPRQTSEAAMLAVNAHATASLARAARRQSVRRFVLVSSLRAVSGPSSSASLAETVTPAPVDAYGRSKLNAELMVRAELPEAIILRPPVLHGAGARGNMASLSRLARLPLPLPIGGLVGRRSILSEANLASAVAFILGRPDVAGRTFHLADGDPMTMAQMIATMRQSVGQFPGVVGLPRGLTEPLVALFARNLVDKLCRDLILDDTALRSLGWYPTEKSAAGLGRMMQGLARHNRL